jgi:ABC-2 type transport system ATP-binding protein
VIETVGLVKRYGQSVALDGVDLSVADGSVYGLVGPNGAGKTTLLALLAGLRKPTAGRLRIDAERREIAVLSDTPRFDEWLTGREVLSLAQHMSTRSTDRVDEVLHDSGLEDAADRAVGGYSRGMLQRLGVACTVVGSPRVVLLDEPASALDPMGRRDVLDLVARLRGSATILFSSHILADVQEVCDTVGILDHGHLRFQGPIGELLVGTAVPRYVVRLRQPSTATMDALRRHDWITEVEETATDEIAITVATLEDAELRLVPALAAAGARVVSLGPEAISLERAFIEVTA